MYTHIYIHIKNIKYIQDVWIYIHKIVYMSICQYVNNGYHLVVDMNDFISLLFLFPVLQNIYYFSNKYEEKENKVPCGLRNGVRGQRVRKAAEGLSAEAREVSSENTSASQTNRQENVPATHLPSSFPLKILENHLF